MIDFMLQRKDVDLYPGSQRAPSRFFNRGSDEEHSDHICCRRSKAEPAHGQSEAARDSRGKPELEGQSGINERAAK